MSDITLNDVLDSLRDGWVLWRCRVCEKVVKSWYEGPENLKTPSPINDEDDSFVRIWRFPCSDECRDKENLATQLIQ